MLGIGLAPGWQLELLAGRQESDLESQVRAIAPPGTGIPDVLITDESDFETTHIHIGVSRTWGDGSAQPFLGAAAGASRVETRPLPAVNPASLEEILTLTNAEEISEAAAGLILRF